MTYYFVAAVALGAPHRSVSFTVPTGNFGDIYAGYVAKKMGLPIERLVIATNVNDILARTLATGAYEVRGVAATTSPSMDIQVSSNFERLLYEESGRDDAVIRSMMGSLGQSGRFAVPEETLSGIRSGFDAGTTDEAQVAETMRRVLGDTGYLIDPHTAVAYAAAKSAKGDASTPMVVLSTAHPAKFPDAVAAIAGVHPALPQRLSRLMTDAERMTGLPNDARAVEDFIRRAIAVQG